MTFISRVGGLVREMMMAHFFGAGVTMSAFTVAYRIPNLFRRLFGEGALSSALIPIYTETIQSQGKAEADRIASAVAGITVAILSAVSAMGILGAVAIARFADLDDRWMEIMPLLQILLPYAPLICLAALVMGVLNSLRSFAISALAPAFQNLFCIVVLAAVCPFLPAEGFFRIRAVAWAILVSGIIQVAVQLPELRRKGVPLSIAIPRPLPDGVRRVFILLAPMAFSAGVVQVNVCLDGILAMKAGVWGPSALAFADRIVYLPLAMFGTAFSTVLLPVLSSLAAERDYAAFSDSFARAIRNSIAVMAPASLGIIALARPIVSLLFETGAFDAQSTTRTAAALVAYSAGLVPAGLHKMAVTAFYARKDVKTPVVIGTAGVFLNLAMNLFFIWILPSELKPIGIAIATAISSTIAAVLLLSLLRGRYDGASLFSWTSVSRTAIVASASAAAMALACRKIASAVAAGLAGTGLDASAKLTHLAELAAAVPIGIAIYFALVRMADATVLRELTSDFITRRRRSRS